MADKSITRDELLNELIAALRDTEPPEDAFSVEEIMNKTGWERESVYGYLKRAKRDGKVETVGRYGRVTYYRTVK